MDNKLEIRGGSLEQFKGILQEEIKNQDVAGMTPKYNRFEITHTENNTSFAFVLNEKDNSVQMFNTSRGLKGAPMEKKTDNFPEGVKTARECFDNLYRKSMNGADGLYFTGYVDEHFNPLEG